MQAAGEAEMTLQIGAGGAKQFQDGFGLRSHKGLLYHRTEIAPRKSCIRGTHRSAPVQQVDTCMPILCAPANIPTVRRLILQGFEFGAGIA
jgi:hypothetical protein